MISAKKSSNLKLVCVASLAIALAFPASAAAKSVSYKIYILTSDFDGAATDNSIHASITGSNGTKTKFLNLDSSGVNDFKRGSWRNYTLSSDLSGNKYTDDVGWPTAITLRMKSDGKGGDACIRQMYVEYNVDGKLLDQVQYMGTGLDNLAGQSCLGKYEPYADDAAGARMERTYYTWQVMPASVAKKIGVQPLRKGHTWQFLCSAGSFKCETGSIKNFSLSTTLKSGWSKQTQAKVERTISTTVKSSYKQGGGSSGAPEQSLESSLTNSLSTAFTTASGTTGGTDKTNGSSIGSTINCAPPLNPTKDVYRSVWLIPFGSESIQFSECRWYCADSPPRPNAIKIGQEKGTCKAG